MNKLIVLLVVLLAVAGLCIWAFGGGSSQDPLRADNILVFKSPAAVAEHYGFINRTYIAALPPSPNDRARPAGFYHYFRVQFATQRPGEVIRQDALAELNRMRAQHGQKPFSQAAMERSQLYTLRADFEEPGLVKPKSFAFPDVGYFQRDPSVFGELYKLVGGVILTVDPGDPHVIELCTGTHNLLDPSAQNLTMRFSADWKTAEVTTGDSAEKTIAQSDQHFPYSGPYIVKLTISAVSGPGPAYTFAGLNKDGLINPAVPAFFRQDGENYGKVYINGRTSKLRAAQRDGAWKLFLDDDAGMISIDPSKPTTSFFPADSLLVSYTAQLEKPDLHGNEQQLAANYADLGTVAEAVLGAPNVWGTYFDVTPRRYSPADIVSNPILHRVFVGTPASSAAGANALDLAEAAAAKGASPRRAGIAPNTPAAKPAAAAPKSDAEIEKEMQEQLRKHQRGY